MYYATLASVFLLTIISFSNASTLAAAQPLVGNVLGGNAAVTFAFVNSEPAPVGSLAGNVLNDPGTGDRPDGVAGVRVSIRSITDVTGAHAQHQISGPGGHFHFAELVVGRYILTVDPLSLPARFHLAGVTILAVDIKPNVRLTVDFPVTAERTIIGTTFIDRDGNGKYQPGKDVPVEGALITVGGAFAVSRADGSYSVRDLPAGRVAMLVQWPGRDDRTHVLLYLPTGPVKGRIVNIGRAR